MRTVFIIGYPRSGTTFFAGLLQKTTGFPATPETRFYEEYEPRGADRLTDYLGAKIRLADMDLPLDRIAAAGPARGAVLAAIFEAFVDGRADGVIEKSPIHQLHVPAIKRDFPDAQVVLIVRHPLMALNSLRNVGWGGAGSARMAALDWKWRMRRSMADARAGRIDHVLRFEDLATDPAGTLDTLRTALDLPLAAPGEAPAADATFVPEWERAWKAKALADPDPERARIVPEKLSAPEQVTILSVCRTEMAHYGYDVDKAGAGDALWSAALAWPMGRRAVKHGLYRSGLNRLLGLRNRGETPIAAG